MRKAVLISGLLLMLIGMAGCYYDNEEDLYPNSGCDTTNVTFSGKVVPILQQNCYICHATAIANGGVILDTYAGVQVVVQNGKLWGSVNHESGFFAMPKDAPKLPDCDLAKIKIWLDKGAPNN